ncbi:MAG TPA: indole-3-glycerol phosphate synthase TrpC [Acidisarcina sp.]|nr:indole-3-glycerol phosphate synthase TrpC [Acidisarcina sp.]
MATQLDNILAATRRALEERRQSVPRRVLEQNAEAHQPRGFAAALRAKAASGAAVIAELKKASPSKGLIRPHFQVTQLARAMEQGGAAALSVLTEESFFQGSLANLAAASEAVRIPCLRKDFIVDEWQLVEARAYSADAILLIVAALSDAELKLLAKNAHSLSLDILCEVHTAEELDRVLDLDLGCDALGVNSRDLRSFVTRIENAIELAPKLPDNVVRVAESGIHTPEDIQRLQAAGYQAFLIGESLMQRPEPGQALAELIGGAAKKPATDRA